MRAPTVLITGASGGIGLELAKLFARDGYSLFLVARNAARLEEIGGDLERRHGIRWRAIPADLSHPEGPAKVVAEVRRSGQASAVDGGAFEGGRVDVLVNNAGIGVYGQFSETDLAQELRMIQLNVTSLTHLTKLFLPPMLERGEGRILNIASTAAFQPGPLMAVYYATKAYVLSFSEALAEELRGSGVRVTTLCPGPTHTGFQAGADMEDSRLMAGSWVMDAETVARTGYAALLRGRRIVVPGLLNNIQVFSVRLTPRSVVTRIVRIVQERRRGRGPRSSVSG